MKSHLKWISTPSCLILSLTALAAYSPVLELELRSIADSKMIFGAMDDSPERSHIDNFY